MNRGMVRAEIIASGIVQGVGFRPFIFRLARGHGLTGSVANTPAGVVIVVNGPEREVDRFEAAIRPGAPPLAVITELTTIRRKIDPEQTHPEFQIRESIPAGEKTGPVTPDSDVCPACLAELLDPADRRFGYPFINCTDCGPRYTLIKQTPYDRPMTAMVDFPMCAACRAEYRDPTDRRFHAQATCCPDCGPHLLLVDASNQPLGSDDPLTAAATRLRAGQIVAIKGLGGFHLAVDATNEQAVTRLRRHKGRPAKPLAVMAPDIDTAASFAGISDHERAWLAGPQKPVVLLRKKNPFELAANLAPDNRYIGVMLPYTPLHHLLLAGVERPALVMTSGNRSGTPIAKDNDEALLQLAGIADCFLLHTRRIVTRVDDSVLRLNDRGQVSLLRRARSFVPTALDLAEDAGRTLALGAMLKDTICLTRNRQAFVSQHIGDLDNLDTLRNLKELIGHFTALLRIEPELIVHDLHPDYPSTRYAREQHLPLVAVQHHHAHAVSCMAEHRLTGPVIAITLDGSGYGPDNTVWGGEVLVAGYADYTRAAHLAPVPLPGGEAAIREPWRMAASHLAHAFGPGFRELELPVLDHYRDKLIPLVQMMEKGINSPLTSSCGRLFDAVAALLNLRYTVSFEGEAAAMLEMVLPGHDHDQGVYDFAIREKAGVPVQLDIAPIIKGVVQDLREQVPAPVISSRFHNTLAELFARTAMLLRGQTGINQVVLSGGVFQNMTLQTALKTRLERIGFTVYVHNQVPANDGGLALGQAVAGHAILQRRNGKG
ncbi:MAG: carbamoyltransferase HypF [Desulfobacterales bacterium]|nr:carbamoyltransferase HypF [Desulfobacterales bacterium]